MSYRDEYLVTPNPLFAQCRACQESERAGFVVAGRLIQPGRFLLIFLWLCKAGLCFPGRGQRKNLFSLG